MKHGVDQKQSLGYAALILATVGNTLATLFYKLSFLTGLHPLWVNCLRMGLTLLILLPMTLYSRAKREAFFHMPKDALHISLLSGIFLGVHFTTWVLALSHTDVYAASAIWGTYLLITALLSAALLHEKTSRAALIGLLIATAGVIVCNLGSGFGKLSGNLLALAAALMQALYTLCGRKARAKMDTNSYTSVVYTVAFVVMLLFALVSGTSTAGFQPQNVLWALCLAVFCTLLGHSMASMALKYFKAPTVSAVPLVAVVTAPLLVFAVLGEAPSPNTLVGGTIIVIGLTWYLVTEYKEAKSKQANAAPRAEAQGQG